MSYRITIMFVSAVLLGMLASAGSAQEPYQQPGEGPRNRHKAPSDIQKQIDELRDNVKTKSRDYVQAIIESKEGIATDAKLTKAAKELEEIQSKLRELVGITTKAPGSYGGGYGAYRDSGYGGGGYGGGAYGGGGYGGYGDDDDDSGGYDAAPGAGYGGYGGHGSAMGAGYGGYGGYGSAGHEKDGSDLDHKDFEGQLQLQTRVLAHQLRTADESQQATVTRAMRKVLGELFERRMKQRESHLQQLEDRLTKLRAQFKRQLDAKNEVIDLRVKTLINEAQGIGF